MPLPAGWRFLTDEEAAIERQAGNTDIRNTIIRDADQAVANVVEEGIDVSDTGKSAVRRGAEFGARQLARVALPLLVGRGAGALGGLALSAPATAPTAGVAPLLGTLGGALIGGGATAYGQEKVLQDLAERRPTSAIAEFVRAGEADIRRHPLLTQATQIALGAPFAGGGLGATLTRQGAKQAGIQAGAQGAIEAGAQLATRGELDPAQLAIAAAGGALTSRPSTGIRNLERRALTGRVPSRFVEAIAPPVARPTSALDRNLLETEFTRQTGEAPGAVTPTMPAHLRPDWNPDYFVNAPVEELAKLRTPLADEVLRLKKANVPLDANDINRLAQGHRTLKQTASDIMLDKFQQLSGQKPPTGAVVLAGEPMAAPKSASQSATDILQAQKDARVKQLIAMTPEELATDGNADARAIAAMREAGFAVDEPTVKSLTSGSKVMSEPADIKRVTAVAPKTEPEVEPVALPTVKPPPIPAAPEPKVGDVVEYQGKKATVTGFTIKDGKRVPTLKLQAETPATGEVKKKVSPEERSLGLSPIVFKDLTEAVNRAVRPGITRVAAKFGPLGEKFKKHYEQMRVEARQLIEPYQDAINKTLATINTSQKNKIDQFLEDRYYTGKSSVQLSPEEQAAVAAHDEIQKLTGLERAKPNSPLVRQVINGTIQARPFVPVANYFNQAPNKRFWKAITRGDQAEKEAVRKLFVDHQMKFGGVNQQQAEEIFNDITTIASGKASPYVEYAQLRLPEGVGLPKELRLNAFDALQRQVNKQGMDIAWHRNLESDPDLGPQLGYREDGRGNPYPKGVANLLGSDEDVRAAMQDYVGLIDPSAQSFETADRLVKTLLVQTPSQIWNILQSAAQLGRVMRVDELGAALKGIKGFFSTPAQQEAIRRGSVRAGRNVNPASAEDAHGFFNGVSDLIQTLTATENLEKRHRTAFDVIGKSISQNRLRTGDTEFFNFWGPADWQSWSADKLTDYTTARFVESMAGSYSAEELPNWITRGSGSKLRPFFSLARWSVGQTNRFIDEVYKPALKGDIKPLLGSITGGLLSAGAINWLKEELTNRKPRELTWEEYLQLGGKDTPYTLASKAATAGYAGALGNIAFQLVAASKGEKPQGFENPALAAATETGERLLQFLNAVQNGDTTFGEGIWPLMQQIAMDRIQLGRMLLESKPDEGKREEAIARRTGYLPPRNLSSGTMVSPFSATGLTRRGDVEGLTGLISNRLARGQNPPGITSAVRTNPDYYKFIAEAQGPEAARAAIERDRELTKRRASMYRAATEPLIRR